MAVLFVNSTEATVTHMFSAVTIPPLGAWPNCLKRPS